MEKYIEFFKNCCMWSVLLVASVLLVNLAIKVCVWVLGIMILVPLQGIGFLIIAALVWIGICQFIDKIKK
jgi:hypothetical protein